MLTRAIDILRDEGAAILVKRGIDRFIYSTSEMYITKYDLGKLDFNSNKPRVNSESCEIVIMTKESYSIPDNYHIPRLMDFNKRLNYGCIAVLIFYQHQLATIGWSCPTLESSKAYKVWHELAKHYADYDNGINIGGGQWTNPKFRSLGFGTYGILQRAKYIYSTGKKITYGLCEIANAPALAMQLKAGAEIVGKVRIASTLFSMKWKELQWVNTSGALPTLC